MTSFFRRLSCGFAAALGLWCASATGDETPGALPHLKEGERINCPGEYPGHLQGIATDGKSIYWSFSSCVVRTDLRGGFLAKAKVPFHGGDPCWYGERLYVPVGSDFNRERPKGKKSNEWIYEFDSALKLVKKHRLVKFQYGAGGIAAHNGRFFVVGGRPPKISGNAVWEYDSRFKPVRRHPVAFDSEMGIQTINRAFGRWYLGCYGTDGCAVVTDDCFGITGRVKPPLAVGMIPLAEENLVLIGVAVWNKDQQHSTAYAIVRRLLPGPAAKPPVRR